MKKENRPKDVTTASQYCIDTLSVEAFVSSLPKSILIYNLRFRGVYRGIRKKLAIPEYAKQLGVKMAAETPNHLDVQGMFDAISVEKVLAATKRIANCYKMDPGKFFVQTVVLIDKDRTSYLTFRRMYKQIRLPNDRRKKKLVLGLVRRDGKDTQDMLARLSGKNIVCTFAKTERTIVLCSEELVAKKGR